MEEHDAGGIHFIGEQIGNIEHIFTRKLSQFFQSFGQPISAYLCRVYYDNPSDVSIAVCIAAPNDLRETSWPESRVFFEICSENMSIWTFFS